MRPRRSFRGRERERVELLKRVAPTASSAEATNRTLGHRWATIRTFEADPLAGEVPAAWGALMVIVPSDTITRTVRVNDRVRARDQLWQIKSVEKGARRVVPDVTLHVEPAIS